MFDWMVNREAGLLRPGQRRDRIVGLLRERERLSVEFLAGELAASPETVRRDLAALARSGVIRKFHGGASLPETEGEGAFQTRLSEHPQEKRAVARRAATLFAPGDTLFVDTGTTTVVFAEELARRSGLTVVTNSVTIAQLVGRGGNNTFLIGGEYRDEAVQTLGALAVEQIGRFRADHAVLTVGAIEPAGVMDYDLGEAELARAMIAQAQTVTVLADSSKLGRRGLFLICPLTRIHRLVVDSAPKGSLAEALLGAGTEVIVADPVREP